MIIRNLNFIQFSFRTVKESLKLLIPGLIITLTFLSFFYAQSRRLNINDDFLLKGILLFASFYFISFFILKLNEFKYYKKPIQILKNNRDALIMIEKEMIIEFYDKLVTVSNSKYNTSIIPEKGLCDIIKTLDITYLFPYRIKNNRFEYIKPIEFIENENDLKKDSDLFTVHTAEKLIIVEFSKGKTHSFIKRLTIDTK